MRGLMLIAGLGLSLAASGAASGAAQAATQTFQVGGSTPQICTVQSPVLSQGALVNFRSLNGTTLQIDQLADPKTLSTIASSADVSFVAVCNYPHRIRLESQNNGLFRGGATGVAPPAGFADGVPYTATLVWGPVSNSFFVDATSRRLSQQVTPVDHGVAGSLKIHLAIQAGASNLSANAPLIAGNYSDTLRVTVEPQ